MNIPDLEDFIRVFQIRPLNSVQRTCEILSIRQTKFYELVAAKTFRPVRNGSRNFVTADQIYEYYRSLLVGQNSEDEAV